MKPAIVYTAFGPDHLHCQAICSILTLWRHISHAAENINIIVYTDKDVLFKKYLQGIPVIYEVLAPETFQDYKGPKNFSFRVKMCVTRDYLKKYGADIFFVDTDTFFLASPEEHIRTISPETTIFHAYEYTANEGNTHEGKVWLQFRKIIKNNEFTVWGNKGKLGIDSEMWNSGVLGISHKNLHLVEEAINLADQITAVEWLKTGEQFAFSYVFQKKTRIVPSDDVVFHYWLSSQKELYNYHIAQFLRKYGAASLEERVEKSSRIVEQRHQLKLPEKTLWQRIKLRSSLILQVAKTGHL